MPRGDISLNAVGYALRAFEDSRLIHRGTKEQFAPVQATEALQRQTQITAYSSRVFPNLTRGFGRNRIDSDSAFKESEYRHFFDSTCDTRFANDVRLGILAENSSGDVTGSYLIAAVNFGGNLWSLWAGLNTTGAIQTIVSRSYTGSTTTWVGGATIFTEAALNDGLLGLDLQADSANLLALVNIFVATVGSYYVYRSTDGITWTQGATVGAANILTAATRRSQTRPSIVTDGGLIAPTDIRGETVIAVWDNVDGQIEFFSTTNSGAAVTAEITRRSGNGPQGIAIYPGIDGADKLFVGTREGLYEIDTSPATWTATLVHPMPPHVDNCRRMLVHNGALWYAQGVDSNSPCPIWRLTVQGDARVIENVGLDQGDGIPAELLGPLRWMTSAGAFLFICIAGTSRNSRILAHNGQGWHTMYRHATSGERIEVLAFSAEDDATPRLHFALFVSTLNDTQFLGQPIVNPQSGVSIKRNASGYIDLPYIDAGLPSVPKAFLRVAGHAIDLSADTTGEYIAVQHGINTNLGAEVVRTNVSTGNFLSGTRTLDLASGAGTSGLSMGARLTLNRDGAINTDTPKLRDFEIDYYAQVPRLQTWDIIVDIAQTARLTSIAHEAVITNLETVRDSVPLVVFVYGNMTSTYVRMSKLEWLEDVRTPGGTPQGATPDTLAQRTGLALVTLEEVLS